MKRSCLLFAAVLAAASAADLPVRRVALYKHGIAYFERSGELKAGEAVQLEFNGSEMDDVLKSLTVEDRSGGRITAIRYDSSEPLDRKVADYPFALGPGESLASLLDKLRGALIDFRTGGQTYSGAIVAGRQSPAAAGQPERELITVLLASGEIRTFDLAALTSLQLRDGELQTQLNDYLATLRSSRSRQKRILYLDRSGSRPGQVAVSYIAPAPVWKSSYRLALAPDGAATIEGWAIVDNLTGEDWTGVRLSVVSGRPVSFLSRLYEPRHASRPVAELPEEQARAPQVHGGAIAAETEASRADKALPAPRLLLSESAGALTAAPAARQPAVSTIAPAAQAQEVGELFEYSFPDLISVRKGESVLAPFLQQKIAARKLFIYSDWSSEHPMNAVELTNSTGKTLDGGPITVYDGGSYGGEALFETCKASDKRLISYATDLGTRITTQFDSRRDFVREVHLRRGVLTSRLALEETRTYTARNADQKAKTLVIEHPVRSGFSLAAPKPSETSARAYRFEMKLAAGATGKLAVTEERVYETTHAVSSLTPDVLAGYVQNRSLSEAARAQLEKLATAKRLLSETDSELNRLQQELNDLSADQARLRQNIDSLNRLAGQQEQAQQYARQLAAQETRLAGLRDQQAELRKKKASQEAELNSLIENLEF